MTAAGRAAEAAVVVADEDPGGDRRDEEDADDARAGDDPPVGQRRHGDADDGVVHGQHEHRRRHLPEHVEVSRQVVEGAVAHEHVAEEQHHLRQQREGDHDRRDGPELGDDVVEPGERPGEHQRQHPLSPVGAHDVGGDDGDEEQQRRRHADVVAVVDDLDAVDDPIAGHVADADVDHGRQRDDRQQDERGDLLAPRAAQPEGAADRGPVQRQRGRPPLAPRPAVRAVAAVVDGAVAAGAEHRHWCTLT